MCQTPEMEYLLVNPNDVVVDLSGGAKKTITAFDALQVYLHIAKVANAPKSRVHKHCMEIISNYYHKDTESAGFSFHHDAKAVCIDPLNSHRIVHGRYSGDVWVRTIGKHGVEDVLCQDDHSNDSKYNRFRNDKLGFSLECMAVSSKWIIVGFYGLPHAKVFHMETGAYAFCLTGGHRLGVVSVDVSADSETFVTGSFDGSVAVWNSTGKLKKKLMPGRDNYTVRYVKVSHDGNTIVTGNPNYGISIFMKINGGYEIDTESQGFAEEYIYGLTHVHFLPLSQRFVTMTNHLGQIFGTVWGVKSVRGRPEVTIKANLEIDSRVGGHSRRYGEFNDLSTSSDGKYILCITINGHLHVWERATGNLVYRQQRIRGKWMEIRIIGPTILICAGPNTNKMNLMIVDADKEISPDDMALTVISKRQKMMSCFEYEHEEEDEDEEEEDEDELKQDDQ